MSMATDVKVRYQSEQVARTYDAHRFGNRIGRWIDALEMRALRKAIEALPKDPPLRTLDIPCATGRITQFLLELGLEVVGGDISEPMLQVAEQKCARFGDRISFQKLDLEQIDLPENSFDLISCIRLFNHLGAEKRSLILRELARVTRRYLVANIAITSPYYRPVAHFRRPFGLVMPKEPWTQRQWEAQAQTAGLRIVQQRAICPWLSDVFVLVFEKQTPDETVNSEKGTRFQKR